MEPINSKTLPMDYTRYLSKDSLVIFLLHGVVEQNNWRIRNYNRKHLEAEFFRKFLKELLVTGNPLSMDDVVHHHFENKPYPPNSFVITFDDGFWNNLSVAAPILQELSLPATFYVTSGFVQNNEMSWIDRIEECLEAQSPKSIRVPWISKPFKLTNRETEIQLLDDIRTKVKGDPTVAVESLIEDIAFQCNCQAPTQSSSQLDRKMSWAEVGLLASKPGFIIAGHSHRHGVLAFLNQEELEWEIDISLRLLQEKSGITSVHYSYPEGMAHSFDERVINTLKNRGIVCLPDSHGRCKSSYG